MLTGGSKEPFCSLKNFFSFLFATLTFLSEQLSPLLILPSLLASWFESFSENESFHLQIKFSLFFSFFNQVNINSNKFVCDCFVLTAFKLTVVSKIKCLFQTRCYIYHSIYKSNFLCFSPFSIRYTDSAVLLRSERLLNTL